MLLPESASTCAPKVDPLFWIILAITGFFFAVVQVCLLLFVLKYRNRPGWKASCIHGNTLVEVAWTVTPALILLALTIASQKARADISTINPLHLPGGAVAQIRLKQDAVPGHYRIKGFVTAEPLAHFQTWLMEPKANE